MSPHPSHSDPGDSWESLDRAEVSRQIRAAVLAAARRPPASRCPAPVAGGRIANLTAAAAIVGSIAFLGPGRDQPFTPQPLPVDPAVSVPVPVEPGRAALQPWPPSSPPRAVDDWAGVASPSDLGVHAGDRSQLDVLLDSMLITHRVPAGVPFEERVGEVPDPRVLEIMRDIDDSLGGRIEWPNVYVTDGLLDDGIVGHYRTPVGSVGQTVPPILNDLRAPEDAFGIHLESAVIECELTHGYPQAISVRQLLAHELQHAVSFDNSSALHDAAQGAGMPYQKSHERATADGRADLAQLLLAEMDQRRHVGGPRLNELSLTDRREVVREVLNKFLTPIPEPSREQSDLRLEVALRDDSYLHEDTNVIWREVRDVFSDTYVQGVHVYDTPGNPFMPTGIDPAQRFVDVDTPLDELAERWTEERAERPVDSAERRERYPSLVDDRQYLGAEPVVVTASAFDPDPVTERSAPRSAGAAVLTSTRGRGQAGSPPSAAADDSGDTARRRRMIAVGGAAIPMPAVAPALAAGGGGDSSRAPVARSAR